MQTINRRTSSKALRPNQDLADKSTEQPREREGEGGREREREDTVIYMCIPYSHYYISLDSNYCYRLIAAVAILWDAVDDFSHAFDSSARLALALLCFAVRFGSPRLFPLVISPCFPYCTWHPVHARVPSVNARTCLMIRK